MSARRSIGTFALLAAILLFGGWLRVRGLAFGLPLDLRPDEVRYQQKCVGFARTGDFNPHQFAYPGLAFYLPYGGARVVHAAESLARPEAERRSFVAFLLDRDSARRSQRGLSAAAGIATLLALFFLGRSVRSTRAGLLAAAFLSIAFLPVRDSHFGTVDAAATLAVTLALHAIVAAAKSRRLGPFVFAGALSGIAAALRYFPAVLALPLLLAVLEARRAEGRRLASALVDPRLLGGAAAMVAFFLAGAPYTLLAFGEFRAGFAFQATASLRDRASPLAVAWRVVSDATPIALGVALTLVAAAGTLVAGIRGPLGPRLVAAFAAAWIVVLSLLPVQFVRYVLPMTPALCLLAATLALDLVARLAPQWRAAAAAALLAGLGIGPLLRSLAIDRLFARPTTFELARRLVEERLDPTTPSSSPHPRLARFLDVEEFAPWDPVEWRRGGRVHLVLARHPHPSIGDDWALFRAAMLADPRCRELLVVRAVEGEPWPDARFEERDLFYYPLDRFSGVERGGPDFALLEFDPSAPPPARAAPLAPPELAASAIRGGVELQLRPASGAVAFAWHVRARPIGVSASGGAPGDDVLLRAPAGRSPTVVPLELPAGRWEVSAAGADFEGLGGWSTPIGIDVR